MATSKSLTDLLALGGGKRWKMLVNRAQISIFHFCKTNKKPPKNRGKMMVGDTELESVTSCMSSKRSNQLS